MWSDMLKGAKQASAEMKDNLKILGNEMDILRTECADKEKSLGKARSDHQVSIKLDHWGPFRFELAPLRLVAEVMDAAPGVYSRT